MKVLINIFESVLLTVALFLVVMCMTILNKRYVKFVLNNHNYYQQVVDTINKDIKYDHEININTVKNDINNYIDNYYMDKTYDNKIITNGVDLTEYYNKQIKFIGPFTNFQLKKDIIDICTIVIVAIIGLLFLKTKKKHNIDLIFIISGILGIICSFFIYIYKCDGIQYNLIRTYFYIYLGINILLMLYPLFKNIYNRIVNKKRINI